MNFKKIHFLLFFMFCLGTVCLLVSSIGLCYGQILMTFTGEVRNGPMNDHFDFEDEPDHCLILTFLIVLFTSNKNGYCRHFSL